MAVRTWLALGWFALAAAALATSKSAFLRGLSITGKVRTSAVISDLPGAALLKVEVRFTLEEQKEVPKRAWTWFYLLGAVYNCTLVIALTFYLSHVRVQRLLQLLQDLPLTKEGNNTSLLHVTPSTMVFLWLFALHNIRRFLECVFITEFGNSRMHFGVLALGSLHYLSVSVSVLADPSALVISKTPLDKRIPSLSLLLTSTGILLFVFASYHQYRCNAILATQKRVNRGQYVVPRGDWFDYVRCPLYTTEILLYAALVLVLQGINVMAYCIGFWVLLNQCVCASFSSAWYDDKFRDAALPKWRLVPYLW